MKEKENQNTNACGLFQLGWLLPILPGFFLAPEFNDRMSDHNAPMSQKAGSFEKKKAVVNHASATQSSRAGWRYRKETALSRGQRRSHSVSAPRFSAIKLDQTGIQWRQRHNFTVPSCTENRERIDLSPPVYLGNPSCRLRLVGRGGCSNLAWVKKSCVLVDLLVGSRWCVA